MSDSGRISGDQCIFCGLVHNPNRMRHDNLTECRDRCAAERDELRALNESLAARVAAQSELLTRKAERKATTP